MPDPAALLSELPELALLPLIVGLIFGSFLNVAIHRLPLIAEIESLAEDVSTLESVSKAPLGKFQDKKKRISAMRRKYNLIWPPSHCPHCMELIRLRHNIPLFGYLWLGGRCADCRHSISPRYPLVELLTGLLTCIVAVKFAGEPHAIGVMVLTWTLVVLAAVDIEHRILPDIVTLPLLWLGLLVNALGSGPALDAGDAIVGAAAGYLSMWLVYHLFKLLTGKDGMGYGDFKLLAALGAWLGWQDLLPVVLLSSTLGLAWAFGGIIAGRRTLDKPLPFGPFLALAGFLMLVWGPQITELYLGLLL